MSCSDFLFFQKGADFFVYDKKSAYLYPIDNLHYEIGNAIQSAYKHNQTTLDIQHFIQNISNIAPGIVEDHYRFIVTLFSERANNLVRHSISKHDIIKSISVVPHIVVEVTEKCNFLCRYCYYGEMYDTISKSQTRCNDMPEDDCLICLREILSQKDLLYSSRSVISFYGGEPFLNFRLIRTIVLFCKEKFPHIDFQFRTTTNGSLLRRHIDFLVEHDFHLLVSLDGDRQSNTHRRYYSGHQAFTTVKQNVDYIYQEHREYFVNNIEFISVLHGNSDIVSICRFFSKYGKTPILTNISSEGIVADKQVVFPYPGVSPQEMQVLFETNRSVYDLIKGASKGAVSINIPLSDNDNPIMRGCYLFANKIFLSADGQIYLCEKSSRKYPFGSFANGMMQFYYKEINRYYDDFDKVLNSSCSHCSLYYSCDRCFFEGPSQMTPPIKCKLSNFEMKKILIRSIEHE